MSTLTADETSPPDQTAGKSAFAALSAVVVIAWGIAGALSAPNLSCLEAWNAAGILIAALAGLFFWRNASRTAECAAARLWTVALFIFAALSLSPAFQRSTSAHNPHEWNRLSQLSALAPLLLMGLLWSFTRAARGAAAVISAPAGPFPARMAEQLEALIDAPSVRLQLLPLAILLTLAGLGLSGQSILVAIVPRSIVLAALLLVALRPLLQMAKSQGGVRAMHAAMALGLGGSALIGAWRYMDLRERVAAGNALLDKDKPDDAIKFHNEAAALNEILQSKSTRLELETQWALFYERKEKYETSLIHWRTVAEINGQEHTETLPIRRVLSKMGDSLTAWRRLIYQGFPAITDPEIASGVRAFSDKPGADLRGKLLAALLSWEEKEPDAERRRRLDEVRKLQPNEPSSNVLLQRMGVNVPDAPLWLPTDLIVGKNISTSSLLGSVEDLGEVDTLVVLDEGSWELALNARGTPLHEEWPVIRVEFNGQVIAHTQVTSSESHDVPITFKVHRGDIYRVKIIFENQQEILDQGHYTRRGLVLNGMMFRRSKE